MISGVRPKPCFDCGRRTQAVDNFPDMRNYLRVMRKSPVLDALLPEIRQKLSAAALLAPEKWWYLSELAAHLGTSPSSLQRELDSLAKSGVLTRKEEGQRTYYKAQVGLPFSSLFAACSPKRRGSFQDCNPSSRGSGTGFGEPRYLARYEDRGERDCRRSPSISRTRREVDCHTSPKLVP